MTNPSDIEEFLDGPLVTWLRSCLPDPSKLTDYDELSDGSLIHQVLLLIDPEPMHAGVRPCLGNHTLRTRNMDCIIKNIKNLYEEELNHVVVALPDACRLGREPDSKEGLQEMHLLLLLLLGCAVQCPNKQVFIERIKTLPINSQHLLVDCIKQVTESQEIVLTPDGIEIVTSELLMDHIKKLTKQRDHLLQFVPILQDEKRTPVSVAGMESQHLAVELADWKAKYRKQRQELEEKSESLAETREELETSRSVIDKIKNEMNNLKTAARVGKAYRDEADALREKAERCDRLEAEVARYKERLADLEYYRVRVDELRQDNLVLEETREVLEEELQKAKHKIEMTAKLEDDLLRSKQAINELSLERDANEEKMQELVEENAHLQLLSRSALQQSLRSDPDINDESYTGDSSLSEQLSSSAQARVLRLELENKRLTSAVESLHEESLNQTNDRILILEKEKKKLSLQVEELEAVKYKMNQQVSELETTVKNAQRDTRKMQDIRDSIQTQHQLKSEEVEDLLREKAKFERRIGDLESSLDGSKKEADRLQSLSSEYKPRVVSLEKELLRLKTTLESKSRDLDTIQNDVEALAKEKSSLSHRLEEANATISRLSEVEKEMRDMESHYEVDKATLAALEKDLVAEKMNSQKLQSTLDKLGLPAETLADPDSAINRMVCNPEVVRAVRERLERSGEGEAAAQTARLQVLVSTLQSQISSLSAQHNALQLANSQLVVEKEELMKEVETLKREYQQTCVDQLTLQGLHETLTSQYEGVVRERDTAREAIREARSEARTNREHGEQLARELQALQIERDRLLQDATSLATLTTEHCKLKEDFRALFTANERVKAEYRSAQEDYKSMRSEVRQAKGSAANLESELEAKREQLNQAELQLTKTLSQCEMLRQVNMNLEEDRRSLMEHVSLLLGQYHELLTHSLEDKEQYHMEEKLFTDKLNHLSRQKEKLEEKIMEQYRRMESTHPKKKGFGASFVRKMRKAGSDLIKGRKSWHEDAARTRGTDSDTSLEDTRTKQGSDTATLHNGSSFSSIKDGVGGPGLGPPGCRRTLYLSSEEAAAATAAPPPEHEDNRSVSGGEPTSTSTPLHNPGLFVYNKVTTVMGGGGGSGGSTPAGGSPAGTLQSRPRHDKPKDKNDIWFEYGCV